MTITGYLDKLERSLMAFLAGLGIASEAGGRGLTGVWSNGEKVAAIGIKLNRSVVSHGFALNLTTDIAYFDGLIPCGHADKRPTSIASLISQRIETDAAARAYARHFESAFDTNLACVPPAS